MSPRSRKTSSTGKPTAVKTTLLLTEELWKRAKVRAAEERRDLRQLLIEGLELVLAKRRGGA